MDYCLFFLEFIFLCFTNGFDKENFAITEEILARSLLNFYSYYADKTHEFIIYAMR